MKGVLALPQVKCNWIITLPQNALESFINAVKNGSLSLYLAPDGIAAAGAALNAGATLLDSAGNLISGVLVVLVVAVVMHLEVVVLLVMIHIKI